MIPSVREGNQRKVPYFFHKTVQYSNGALFFESVFARITFKKLRTLMPKTLSFSLLK